MWFVEQMHGHYPSSTVPSTTATVASRLCAAATQQDPGPPIHHVVELPPPNHILQGSRTDIFGAGVTPELAHKGEVSQQ